MKGAWSDTYFSWHRVPDTHRAVPQVPATSESRALLQIYLVDAATGILKVIRVVTLTPPQTRYLHRAIRRQAERPLEPADYDKEVERLQGQTCRE